MVRLLDVGAGHRGGYLHRGWGSGQHPLPGGEAEEDLDLILSGCFFSLRCGTIPYPIRVLLLFVAEQYRIQSGFFFFVCGRVSSPSVKH